MKNRFFNITCCLAVSLLVSCVHHTEDIFDKPAAERIAESLQTYRELLTAQTNGWLVEYYPEKTRKYGGFNLYFLFGDVNVTVRSEIDPAASATSAWSTGTDMGPTINFDTYNKVLHYFSDPAIPQGGGYGLNYEGDYEFVVESGTASEFILRGKKTGNIIRMTPFPANLSWYEYSQFLNAMDQNVIAPAYKMKVNDREISIVKSVGANAFILKVGNVTTFAPFMVTLTGIKFYEPITILTETLQILTYHATEDKLVSENQKSEISFDLVSLSKYFVDNLNSTDWYFSTENIATGSAFETAWNTAKNSLENIDETLAFMWFGIIDPEYSAGISFASWDGSILYGGTFAYNFETVSDNRIRLVYSGSRNAGLANWYANNAPGFTSFTVTAFNGKTFTLEPDVDITNPKNMARIKEMKLTDILNQNSWIKVGLDEKIWP